MLLTRRNFLEGAAASAALAGLPAGLCASLAQQVSSPATRQRLADGWEHFQGPLSNPWQVWHSADMAVWSPCSMPHCFNAYDACDPDTPYYRGQGWYRTHVRIDNPFPNGRTLLHFEGAGQTAAAYVNQTLVGRHIGGYDEFVFDITDAVAAEAKAPAVAGSAGQPVGTPIAVLCDNSPDVDRIPSDQSDFSLYGGLYRHLSLVYVPAVSIEHFHVLCDLPAGTDLNGPVQARILARLYNPAALQQSLTVTMEILGPSGERVAAVTHQLDTWEGMVEAGRFAIARPALWSPSSPALYRCRLTVSGPAGDSTLEQTFGIRKAEFVEHGPFLLNGERLLLRGTHRHEDHAGYAAALPDEVIDREMQLIKSMGANFIRLAHYQQSRRVLDCCDRLGLLVWEEVPWCRAGVGSQTMQQLAFDRLATMIDEHYNHPSIVLWGLGNEDDWPGEYPDLNQKAIRGFMAKLNDIAHTRGASRLTTYRRCDFARDIPDVYSPSIWAGWYSGRYTEYQASLEKQRERVKRMFHAEWGADSHAGRHAEDPYKLLGGVQTGKGTDERGLAYKNIGGDARPSRDGDWSETYACDLFDWHLKVQETLPWLTGSAQWIFKDFTTPLRVENPVPRINQKGVVQRDLTPKESFYVFQSYWSAEPMVRIYGHSWPVRWGQPGEARLVRVYSNCPEAELFVNGVSAGVRHRDSQDFPCAGLRWMTPFKPGRNRLRVVAKTAAGQAIMDQIDFDYQTAECGKPAKLVLQQKPTAGPAAKGRATLAGAGSLIDNLGTPAGSRVVQLANGRAEISIATAGACTVGVSAKDLPAAFVSLQHG